MHRACITPGGTWRRRGSGDERALKILLSEQTAALLEDQRTNSSTATREQGGIDRRSSGDGRTKPRLQQRPERNTRRKTAQHGAIELSLHGYWTGIEGASSRHVKRGDLRSIRPILQTRLHLVEHVGGGSAKECTAGAN